MMLELIVLAGLATVAYVVVRVRERKLVDQHERQLKIERQNTREQSDRLQNFLSGIQASPNGVVLLDKDKRIEWCNQTAASLLGIDQQRDIAQHVTHLIRTPVFVDYVSRAFEVAGLKFEEIEFDHKALQLHPYGDGKALLLVRDASELARADAMRRDFVANVSHEIRTPLTVMMGFIETLQTLPLTELQRAHYLQLMSEQGVRLDRLVHDLLVLSRLDSGQKLAHQNVDVATLLKQCETEARALAGQFHRQLTLVFQVEDNDSIEGSATELHSAFSNLMANAIRYSKDGGQVTVTWAERTLCVQDTGVGISSEHLPRLTERFYRVDGSRSRGTGGTGLGLAIVKHVAQRHGARLEIDSTVGVGSTFRLVFAK
jgi:two-component system, OmpR family, phosphate regulon sensor histidine kinase PhoR